MSDEMRNPWAPAPGPIDDDSAENSFSHSTPIEPGMVVGAAPHTVYGDAEAIVASPVAPPPVTPPVTPPTVTSVVAPAPAPAPEVMASPAPDLVNSASISNTVDREDLDRTVISRAASHLWALQSHGSVTADFSIGSIVVGRNPRAPREYSTAQIVVINDPTRTVSKTHALFEYIGGAWYVTDLGSTNGVVLVDAHGGQSQVAPGHRAPVTGHFFLGDLDLWFVQGGA